MGTLRIALAPVPRMRLRVVLEGREYELGLRWSMREARWYLDLRTTAGAALLLGLALVPGWPVLYRFRGLPGLPPGELLLSAPGGTVELDDVASGRLLYQEAA